MAVTNCIVWLIGFGLLADIVKYVASKIHDACVHADRNKALLTAGQYDKVD